MAFTPNVRTKTSFDTYHSIPFSVGCTPASLSTRGVCWCSVFGLRTLHVAQNNTIAVSNVRETESIKSLFNLDSRWTITLGFHRYATDTQGEMLVLSKWWSVSQRSRTKDLVKFAKKEKDKPSSLHHGRIPKTRTPVDRDTSSDSV